MKKKILFAVICVVLLMGILASPASASPKPIPLPTLGIPLVGVEIKSPAEGAAFDLTNIQRMTPTADVRVKVRAYGLFNNVITSISMKQTRTDTTPRQSQEFSFFETNKDPIEPGDMPDATADVTHSVTYAFPTGSWTLEFTAYDAKGNSGTATVHFRVLPPPEPNPGQVTIVDVNPKQGNPTVMVKGGAAPQYIEGTEVTIFGRNMAANDRLKVYLSPNCNLVDPTYEDTGGLPVLQDGWVLYEAEIADKGYDSAKGQDYIKFKIPSIPDMTPCTTNEGALLYDPYQINWRVIVQDN